MDLSAIPTEDLKALKTKDLSKVSTATLQLLKGGQAAASPVPGDRGPGLPPNEPGLQEVPLTEAPALMAGRGLMNPVGKAAAQQLPQTFKQAALIGAGPLISDAGAAIKAAGETPLAQKAAAGMGNMLADVIASISSKDPETVKLMFENPKLIWTKATELFGRKRQEDLIGTIESNFRQHGDNYGAVEDSISGNFGTPSYGKAPEVMLRGTFEKTKFQMAKEGFRIPEGLTEGGIKSPVVGKIAQDAPEYKFLIEQLKSIKENPRMAFGDALRLKQNLDKAIDWGLEGSNGMQPISEDASRILKTMRKEISAGLRGAVPAEIRPSWDKANQAYAEASQAREELKKQVMGIRPHLTQKKFEQLIKEGRYNDEIMDRAKKLGASTMTAMNEVRDTVAANQFKRWIKEPNASGFIPGSPRAVGMGISGAGGGAQLAKVLGNIAANQPNVTAALVSHAFARGKKQDQDVK